MEEATEEELMDAAARADRTGELWGMELRILGEYILSCKHEAVHTLD